MADFACSFVEPATLPTLYLLFLPLADPVNFGAVIMPLTAVSDTLPPTVTVVSPPLGRIGRYATVVLRVADLFQLVRTNLWVEYGNGNAEMIYGRGQFMRRFHGPGPSSASTAVELSDDKEIEFTLRPLGGWPTGAMVFQVEPVDIGNNVST